MKKAILAKKIGMTQLYTEEGALVTVTVLEAGPCTVLDVKDQSKNKYSAVKLGFDDKKESRTNKADMGNFKKSGSKPKRYLREIRLEPAGDYKVGQEIKVEIFEIGEFVDITGISKGKGFQGGVKRWNWTGGKGGHGSMHHRAPGSIGASSFPSRVVKGHHLPGHLGVEQITAQNIEIVKVDKDNNLLVVKGSVPGHNDSYLIVKSAKKKSKAKKQAKKETKTN